MLFENFIFNALRERLKLKLSAATLHFWRTQDKTEVDFVINTGLTIIPVEVKYATFNAPQITRSFRSFLDKYKPKEAYIVHLGDYLQTSHEGTSIHFLPFYNLQAIIERV